MPTMSRKEGESACGRDIAPCLYPVPIDPPCRVAACLQCHVDRGNRPSIPVESPVYLRPGHPHDAMSRKEGGSMGNRVQTYLRDIASCLWGNQSGLQKQLAFDCRTGDALDKVALENEEKNEHRQCIEH
jgi:hypothetical protein